MSKLNPSTKGNSKDTTVRLAGGTGEFAAKQSDIGTLRRLVLANLLWEDIAYADGDSVSAQISALIPKCNPQQVADLAVESRVEQKLRHTPLFIVAEMTKYETHKAYVKDILPKIITRADMCSKTVKFRMKVRHLASFTLTVIRRSIYVVTVDRLRELCGEATDTCWSADQSRRNFCPRSSNG